MLQFMTVLSSTIRFLFGRYSILLVAASSGLHLLKPVSVTREMKGLLFILLVAALLFVGGYITLVPRYEKTLLTVFKFFFFTQFLL